MQFFFKLGSLKIFPSLFFPVTDCNCFQMDPNESSAKRPKLSHENMDRAMSVENLSSFEKIPAELAWKIIRMVPGSWFALKTVSFFLEDSKTLSVVYVL